jgi:hypothetical protein
MYFLQKCKRKFYKVEAMVDSAKSGWTWVNFHGVTAKKWKEQNSFFKNTK